MINLAHRRAVLDYEHERCLQQLNVWRKAEQRFIRVTSVILHLECASLLTDSINVVQVADLPVREDIAEKTKDAQVIQTPKLYLSLAEVPPPSPNVGFIEVLQFNGVSTDKSVKELEYEVRVLTSKSKQLMEENIRLDTGS